MFHPYSDRPEAGISTNCYAYEEAFGEKLRALAERTRPRDLYDVVNLYRHTDSRPTASVLRDVLLQKCAYKSIPLPTVDALASHREPWRRPGKICWGINFRFFHALDDFWKALPEIFNWMMGAPPPSNVPISAFCR